MCVVATVVQGLARELDEHIERVYALLGSFEYERASQECVRLLGLFPGERRLDMLQAWVDTRLGRKPAEPLLLLAEDLSRDAQSPLVQRGEALLLLGTHSLESGLGVQAVKELTTALSCFDQGGHHVHEGVTVSQLLSYLVRIGDLGEIERLTTSFAARLQGRFAWLDAGLLVGQATAAYMRAEAGDTQSRALCVQMYLQLRDLVERAGLRAMRRLVVINLAVNAALAADEALATDCLDRLDADEIQDVWLQAPTSRCWRLYARAILALQRACFDDAAALLASALEQALQEPHRTLNARLKIHQARAELAWRQGRVEAGREAMYQRQAIQDELTRQLHQQHAAGIEALMGSAALSTELASRNAELQILVDRLRDEVQRREQVEQALRLANEEMEQRVRQRSAELSEVQQALHRHEQRLVVNRLLMGVAHQLNTPLGTARLSASAMAGQLQAVVRRLGEPMRRQELVSMLNDLSDAAVLVELNLRRSSRLLERFTELGLHEHIHVRSRFFPAVLVREVLEQLSDELAQAGIRPVLTLDETLVCLGAREALSRVLQHLIRNALLYGQTPGAPTWLGVELVAEPDGRGLRIDVADRGPGMDAARREAAFQPFADGLRTEGGLGLALVRNLVEELLDGQISLMTNEPGGLRVRLCLPGGATRPGL